MKDRPATVLKKLIQQYGSDLTMDARRTEALLNDLCPTNGREVFVLVNAQRQQVPADLLAAPRWMPADAVVARLSRRLQDRLALSEEAADWAVRSWADALGLGHKRSSRISRWFGEGRTGMLKPAARKRGSSERQTEPIDVQSSVRGEGRTAADSRAAPRGRIGWGKGRTRRASPRISVWLAAATATVVLVGTFVAWTEPWHAVVDLAGMGRSPSRLVEREYVLPRYAWVSDGPLLVRQSPDMSGEILSMLDAGDSVKVTEFSSNMQWSRIDEPITGWVSNRYLYFLAPGDPVLPVQLAYAEMHTATENVPVYASPDAASDFVTLLAANLPAVTIASTTDDQWRQILSPVSGWVASSHLKEDDP
jgi:hypothetical protein